MLRFETFETGEVTLNVALAGDSTKPLILCLHGFPEFWIGWHDVMLDLAADFLIAAPDLRGFNLSSKPGGIDAYRTRNIVTDLTRLAGRFSPGKPFVLAGHDWGASVAYAFAFSQPDLLTHLIVANGVHPACFQRAIFEDEGQRRASQYINRLRAPDADGRMAENDFARTLNMLAGFSKIDWMNEPLKAEYIAAWSQPGAMTAMLNWYRASPVVVPAPGETPGDAYVLTLSDDVLKVRVPHLVIWGEADEALRPACLDGLDRYAADLSVRRIAGAGHWILHEKPAEVAAEIRAFLAKG